MKAIEVKSTKIHCDTCHHEFDGCPYDWHSKPCPACGADGIINDSDIEKWEAMHELMDIINGLVGDVDPEEAGQAFSAGVSTANGNLDISINLENEK